VTGGGGIMVGMADSDAVRQQRRRHHRAGDHSMCRRGCQDGRAPVKIAEVPAGSGESLDAGGALRDLAVQLQAAYQADPGNALLARELRSTLLALAPSPGAAADAEWQALMAELSRPVPRDRAGEWRDGG
jgi:hypothetical protein